MPDSFGRIESHCFGCEGIFNSATSQNVAERIFTRLAKERPESPQVFYLLGYLRQNQKRPEEAAAAFRRAVELDPDYVNAWKKLSELAEHSAELTKERDEAALALFRLTREEQAIRRVSDLPRLWDAILQAEENMPTPLKGPVYRLPAAGKEDDSEHRFYFSTGNDPSLAPREKFASNSIMSNVVDVMKLLLAKP
jgi:tetratricopeptide (TPR) repeat protein